MHLNRSQNSCKIEGVEKNCTKIENTRIFQYVVLKWFQLVSTRTAPDIYVYILYIIYKYTSVAPDTYLEY